MSWVTKNCHAENVFKRSSKCLWDQQMLAGIHQNNHKNIENPKDDGKLDNIRTHDVFCKIGKEEKVTEIVMRCLNMFTIGDTCNQALNEELFRLYENVANENMKKIVIEVYLKAHYLPL